MVSLSSRDS